MGAFWGMHVSPAKHSYAWLPRKCDYQTDRHTHRQTPDKVIPMCRYASQATQSVTTRQTDTRTDRRRTKWSLCAAMLRRRHKNCYHLACKTVIFMGPVLLIIAKMWWPSIWKWYFLQFQGDIHLFGNFNVKSLIILKWHRLILMWHHLILKWYRLIFQ